ncbi:hypothetical protein LEN26_016413 [Aphanomyces euteiches]|nr:hypothetical protein LEN26_016413 [Aphanomyces euteiches]KAH9122925.1 hypothetical protein AeMF1_005970 [Aphanomyces euteiches]KAH9182322.1 hypothetical protein AeNC1_015704 [Aphanomyces euteiches]
MDKFVTKATKRTAPDGASSESSAKKAKGTSGAPLPALESCKWETYGSILYMRNFTAVPSTDAVKVASFDLDGTIITTKSGKTFATNANDWKFWHESVPAKLRELAADNYSIVIFSNQSGLSKGKVKETELKTKLNSIVAQLGVPVRVFLLSADDHMRKPRVGAWEFMLSHCQLQVDLAQSFYCGDAAGRPKAAGKPKKDFSCGDYKFAVNIGVPFMTPEKLFLNSTLTLHTKETSFELDFDPRTLLAETKAILPEWQLAPTSSQEVVLLIGSPGSGKSTLYKSYFSSYGRVNQDALKTPAKCKAAAVEFLKEGKSIVIDNTNRDVKTRSEWIQLAEDHEVPIRAFYLDIPKPLVFHLNEFRKLQKELHPDRSEAKPNVPDMVIHGFYKNMIVPTTEEGFASVVHLPFIPAPGLDAADKKLLASFLLG